MEAGGASVKAAAGASTAPSNRTMAIVSVLKGNLTPWWFFGTIFVIYFLCALGLPRVETDGAVMGTHIPLAFMFVVVCAWNLYHTPSHGPTFRQLHKIVGWTAMAVGFFSILTGCARALSDPLGGAAMRSTVMPWSRVPQAVY